VEKGSGGRMKVKIFPSGTLGKETDILQAVRSNAVQMTSASMVTLSRIFSPAQVMMAPYVFKNDAVAWEVVDGPFGQKLLDAFTAKTGIKALAIVDSGFLTITNRKRPVRTPADFKGIKFRAMGPLQAAMFKSLGASAVPIPWPETYTSLQTGVADGQTNAAFVVAVFKLYEVQKYMSLANSQFGYQIWLCNKSWYDSLSDADKVILRDAIKAGRLSTRSMALLREQESLTQLKKEGMQIAALTGAEISALQKLAVNLCTPRNCMKIGHGSNNPSIWRK
jgi:tripartite ATP-independent transporter DctP family solute receptor